MAHSAAKVLHNNYDGKEELTEYNGVWFMSLYIGYVWDMYVIAAQTEQSDRLQGRSCEGEKMQPIWAYFVALAQL